MPDLHSLSLDEFQLEVARVLKVAPASITPDTNFITDIGLDSLRLLQVILEMEKMGVRVSIADAWGIQTVGEAYQYYQDHFSPQKNR